MTTELPTQTLTSLKAQDLAINSKAAEVSATSADAATRRPSLSTYFEHEAQSFWKVRLSRPGARIELRNLIEELQLAAIDEAADPFLLWAMAERESRLRPTARGAHGEVGLLQMKPSTSAWLTAKTSPIGECGQPQTRADWESALERPACNWRIGARYVQWLSSQWYRPQDPMARRFSVLRAYNIGPTRAVQVERESSEPSAYALSISGRAEVLREEFIEHRIASLSSGYGSATQLAQMRMTEQNAQELSSPRLSHSVTTTTQSARPAKFHDKLLIARSH
jgi:hypothetical protein